MKLTVNPFGVDSMKTKLPEHGPLVLTGAKTHLDARYLRVVLLALVLIVVAPCLAVAQAKGKAARKQAAAGRKPAASSGGEQDAAATQPLPTNELIEQKPSWVAQQWERLSPRQKQMVEDGFLDVTVYNGWQGNAVDPTGVADSTAALNEAIGVGRDFDLTLYFPRGTYLASDTLNCRQTANIGFSGRKKTTITRSSRMHTCKLYGDRQTRPTIRLKDGAAGFGSPGSPKCVVAMWQQREPENLTDYRNGFPAGCYYAVIDGITIDCGRNPGAVGLFYKGAQGSVVANVKIIATHAYAGLEGGSWATGGVYGLEVEGGQYGVLIDGNPPCYVGLTLKNQTKSAMNFTGGAGPVTVCGFQIEGTAVPVLTLPTGGRFDSSVHGNLILMDGTIALSGGGTAIDNTAGKNVYLENVYFRGASAAIRSGDEKPVGCEGDWTHLTQCRYCNKNTKSTGSGWNVRCPSDCLIDGQVTKETGLRMDSAAPPVDLVARHLWGRIPEYGDGDPEVKNAVRDLGLDNTGSKPVTAALQAAIDRYEKILLPKGRYLIDGTIKLKANTKLLGASPNNTLLEVSQEWKPKTETPVLDTEDAADGTAVLSCMYIQYPVAPVGTYNFNLLTWRVGRQSVVKEVAARYGDWLNAEKSPGYALSRYRIKGSGGGRWYSSIHECKISSNNPDFHLLTIENTTEPLTLYHYGGIHSLGGDQTVIRDARNVRFIGYNLEPKPNNIFHVINSRNIGFYGFGNTTVRAPDTALVRLTNCQDVLCAMFAQPKNLESTNTHAFQFFESAGGKSAGIGIAGDRVLCVYRKGQFAYPDWAPSASAPSATASGPKKGPSPPTRNH
jgi:hypothetical protein